MPSPLLGITSDTARVGMDALSLRQTVIARNVAQMGVPGFRPMHVSFADKLAEAAQATNRDERWLDELAVTVSGATVHSASVDSMTLDSQVVELNQVTVHYQALARALNRHFATMSLAVNEGR